MRRLIWLLVLGCLLVPNVGFAQESPDLVVSLRDEYGGGVVADIVVRDATGRIEFARTGTDARGIATIAALPVSEVRVAAEGALPDGTPLFGRGEDALGVRVFLNAGSTRLDLRVDPDGAVVPDPATMIEQEGIEIEPLAVPTAPIAAPPVEAPLVRPTPAVARPAQATSRPAGDMPRQSSGASGGLLIVALLGGAIGGVFLLRRRV